MWWQCIAFASTSYLFSRQQHFSADFLGTGTSTGCSNLDQYEIDIRLRWMQQIHIFSSSFISPKATSFNQYQLAYNLLHRCVLFVVIQELKVVSYLKYEFALFSYTVWFWLAQAHAQRPAADENWVTYPQLSYWGPKSPSHAFSGFTLPVRIIPNSWS